MLTLVRSLPVSPLAGFQKFLETQGCAAGTVAAYLSDLKATGLSAISTTDVGLHQTYALRILSDESVAPSTQARRLSSAAKFYEFLSEGATSNPYRTIKRPRSGVVLPRIVPDPEVSRTLIEYLRERGDAQSRMYAAVIALMAGAGLRVSETCSLRYSDLDAAGSSLRVVNGKGRKTRDVPLSHYVLTVVREYILGTARARDASNADRIFPVTPRSIQRAVTATAKAAGQDKRLHPHAFRHGFGTAVQRAKGDLRLTADLLGHESIQTAVVYTHLTDDRRAEAVEVAL